MAVELYTNFDYTALDKSLAAFSSLSADAARKAPMKAARGFTRRIVDITPPASPGRTGLTARRQGEAAINRDLNGIFFPVVLKGARREQWPDVEGIYHQIMDGRIGRSSPRLGQKYHVDARKLDALRQKLFARIGFLAAGWNAAAESLGVDLPAWVRRHGTQNGSCDVRVDDNDEMLITIINAVEYSGDVNGYIRRVQFALEYEADALTRETDYLIAAAIEKSGLASV